MRFWGNGACGHRGPGGRWTARAAGYVRPSRRSAPAGQSAGAAIPQTLRAGRLNPRNTTAWRSARARSSGSPSPMLRRCAKLVVRKLNFRKRRASASQSSSRRTAAWFRSSSRVARGKTSARARRCLGGRRSCRWRTRKGAGRRFMRARSRAESKRPGVSCFAARFAPLGALKVHAVGDGAPWIVGQVEARFGDQGRYLIDFYHVCEYLAAASEAIAPDAARREAGWRRKRTRSNAAVSAPSCARSPDVVSPLKSMTSMRPCEPAIAISAPAPTD